jgi:hypothetical protein
MGIGLHEAGAADLDLAQSSEVQFLTVDAPDDPIRFNQQLHHAGTSPARRADVLRRILRRG